MARKVTRRTSKPARRKVPLFALQVELPPETTREQVEKLEALLQGRGVRLEDLFRADVIASTGIEPKSPLRMNDLEHHLRRRPQKPRR